jgi:hypothetical protein
VNADHLIDLRILSSNNSSFIIQLSDIKYDTKCLLKNQQGVILYKEDIARAQIFQRSLNLIELPDGTYELQIEDDYKTETTSLTKSNGKVMAANQIKITTFKPQIVLKDTQLNVSLLALNNEKLTVSILDENQNPVNNGCAVIDARTAIARADIDTPGTYQVGWRVVSGDGHPISGSFSFVVENNSGYIADPDYLFTECANPYDPESLVVESQTPEYLYWLLWASLPLAAVGLFLLLRSKNKSSGDNRKDPEQKTEN